MDKHSFNTMDLRLLTHVLSFFRLKCLPYMTRICCSCIGNL